MKTSVFHALGWVLVGMVIMGLIVWFAMPAMMLVTHKSDRGYEDTIAAVSEAVKGKQDWRVLTVYDYQQTTSAFGQIERTGSVSICNPRYASRILANSADRRVTAIMPLGIGVYEDDTGQVYVSQLNVRLMGMMFGGTIAEVMGAAGTDLNAAIASVTAQ